MTNLLLERGRVLLGSIALGLFFAATVAAQQTAETPAKSNPQEVLRTAQTIFVRSETIYLKAAALEQALLERSEVQAWGFAISRTETDADLIIEVDRKRFTNSFVFSVLDPKTKHVLLAGKIGSLGGSVEGQIANGFVKRLQKVRPMPAQK